MNFKKLLMIALFSFGLVNSAFAKDISASIAAFANAMMHYQDGNYEKAFPLFKESEELGGNNPVVQSILGKMYYSGSGTTKNVKQAVYWFQKAAEQGDSDSAGILGHIYYQGELGGKPDFKKAAYWYQKVKDGELKGPAQHIIGGMYYLGKGVKQDRKKARQYFKLSCDNGYQEACKVLRKLTQ